jgi:molecular chaperone DnaK
MEYVVGIDLGTTNTCVAIVEPARPRSSPTRAATRPRRRWSRSPRAASAWSATSPSARSSPTRENTVYAAKRLIGRKWNSTAGRTVAQTCPYTIVEGPHGDIRLKIRDHVYSVPRSAPSSSPR